MDKKEYRKGVLADIASLSKDYLEESNAGIREHFLAMPEYKKASVIFAYISEGREPDTVGIIQNALADGKTVALPVSLAGGVMVPRVIYSLEIGRAHV